MSGEFDDTSTESGEAIEDDTSDFSSEESSSDIEADVPEESFDDTTDGEEIGDTEDSVTEEIQEDEGPSELDEMPLESDENSDTGYIDDLAESEDDMGDSLEEASDDFPEQSDVIGDELSEEVEDLDDGKEEHLSDAEEIPEESVETKLEVEEQSSEMEEIPEESIDTDDSTETEGIGDDAIQGDAVAADTRGYASSDAEPLDDDYGFKDYMYKDVTDLEPSDGRVLRKDPELWEGDIGNSKMFADDPEVQKIMEAYGQDGVEYRNNNPDFRPFTKHHSDQWGDFVGEVPIYDMKADRDSFGNTIDSRTLNRGIDPERDLITNSDLGNYAQADYMMAKRLGTTPEAVKDYMKENNLTWHECRDGVTMQMVPTKINSHFKHSGGVSMVKNEYAMGAEGTGGIQRDYSQLVDRRGKPVAKNR